jgi:hypothetical protein
VPHVIVKLWLESRAGEDEGRGLSAPRKFSGSALSLLNRELRVAEKGTKRARNVPFLCP